MTVLEITIQRRSGNTWPVVLERSQVGELPLRAEGELDLGAGWWEQLLALALDPIAYGTVLGKALFRDAVRDAFVTARNESGDDLRTLLVVEDAELKLLHWERLCAPIRSGGIWGLLGTDQRSVFSLYLPSLADRRFRAIGRRDLRALVLVANPPEGNQYSLHCFDESVTIAGIRAALGDLPHDLLGGVPGAIGEPTLNELVARITGGRYTLLHIVAHGWYDDSCGETILYLLDDAGQIAPVAASRLVERLEQIEGNLGLPRLTFLATCESAAPEGERAGALGGLAQRLVRDLGLPAVVAMTQKVSVATATALAREFYVRLRDHGEADRALVQATARLAEARDITVPALYHRLAGQPLFSDAPDRDLTESDIAFGLSRLEALLPTRAPVLQEEFAKQTKQLRGMLGAGHENLSDAARIEWDQTLASVNAMSEESLDLSFPALALGKDPPAYDDRCPFPGLLAFGVRFATTRERTQDDRRFFFGREHLIKELGTKLAQHPFLAVLGGSGSGKSSLVLAGLVSALEKTYPSLQMAYMTPSSNPVARLDAALGTGTFDMQFEWGAAEPPPGTANTAAILVVDQFEELFTLTKDDSERREFVERLLKLTKQCFVVITMRADFWGDCAGYAALRDAMLAHQVLIAPMASAELRSAMEQQAAAVGLRFEADLSNTILDAVEGEPGAMPLLQHLLLEMWKRRHGRWLRASEYRALGGIQQAIACTADGLYESLAPNEQQLVRHIFVRLTRLVPYSGGDPERPNVRQRVALTTLVPEGQDTATIRAIVNRLADARLIFVNAEQVEVTHEALIRYWPTLHEWLDHDRAAVELRETIQNAATAWNVSRQPDLLVHRRDQLRSAINLRSHPWVHLSALEVEYLEMCQQTAHSWFHITIHPRRDSGYLVVVEYRRPESWLLLRSYRVMRFDDPSYEYLQRAPLSSREYGMALGRAVFTEELYFSFVQAWLARVEPLRVCITVEDPQLQLLHWEKLHAPLNNGRWDYLSTTSIYSLNYDSAVQHTCWPLNRQGLRALIFIAAPVDLGDAASRLDTDNIARYIRDSLGGVECDLLGRASRSSGPATLAALREALVTETYPIVHVVAHGYFNYQSRNRGLIFEDANQNAVPVSGDEFIESLQSLNGNWTLPLFLYLDAGGASDLNDRNVRGRLGARLVAEVGIPAVLAMTRAFPLTTSQVLTEQFYPRFLEHGEPDRALAEARERLFSDPYSFIPFVYSSLRGKSLFSEKTKNRERQSNQAINAEITVHSGAKDTEKWLVTTLYRRQGWLLPSRYESLLSISLEELGQNSANPLGYGVMLGRALLHPSVATRIMEDVNVGTPEIRIQLIVEAPELKELRWEWLSLTTESGIARFVASLPGVLLSQMVFSSLNHTPPGLDCEQLKALAIVAIHDIDNTSVTPIAELVESTTRALSGYSLDVLSSKGLGADRSTLEMIFAKMNMTQYAIMHLVARIVSSRNDSDVLIGLEKEREEVDVVRLPRLLERFNAARYLPQLAFLMSPYSNDMTAAGALSRLARSIAEASGALAAVALSDNMSKKTSEAFAAAFYRSLRTHGIVDRAYNEACIEVSQYPDFVPPVIFSRLRDYPLFYCRGEVPITGSTGLKTTIGIGMRDALRS